MANNKPTFVVTGPVRLSYAYLTRPQTKDGQEPKYSTTMLIPKSDVATVQRINAAIEAATKEGVASKWNGQRPAILAMPLHDGDGPRPSDGAAFGPECRGCWVMTASCKATSRPEIVDAGLNPIVNGFDVYSGMYARVSLNFFAYNSGGKKGIGCGLGNVQKVSDGEPLGSRTSASSDFGDGASMQQYAAPTSYTPQTQQYAAHTTPAPSYAAPTQPTAYAQQASAYNPMQYQPMGVNPVTGQPMNPHSA